jgi:hypothetical protein
MFGKAAIVNALVSAVSAGKLMRTSMFNFTILTARRHCLVGWTFQRDELVGRPREMVVGKSGRQLPVLHTRIWRSFQICQPLAFLQEPGRHWVEAGRKDHNRQHSQVEFGK